MITLKEKSGKRGYNTISIITLTVAIFDPHFVFFLQGQHYQSRTCFIINAVCSSCHCPYPIYSIEHDDYINVPRTVALYIDNEDIFPRCGSSIYPSSWVVSIPGVLVDHIKYQGTTIPRTTRRRY